MTGHVPSFHAESAERCELYAKRRQIRIERMLGWGTQGIVFETVYGSVVKGLKRMSEFERERNVYQRLDDHNVTEISGFSIAKFLGFDNDLLVVEMGFVAPPCVIDFASAELDTKTVFPEEMISPWRRQEEDAFGERVDEARLIAFAFEKYGIYLSDLNPGNIRFATTDQQFPVATADVPSRMSYADSAAQLT